MNSRVPRATSFLASQCPGTVNDRPLSSGPRLRMKGTAAVAQSSASGTLRSFPQRPRPECLQACSSSCRCTDLFCTTDLKIDVEGAEWPALTEMLAQRSTDNVKQMIFEIHTPMMLNNKMTSAHLGQVLLDLERLQSELGFRLFQEKHSNGCCGRFADLTRFKSRRICCVELFYVNINLVERD